MTIFETRVHQAMRQYDIPRTRLWGAAEAHIQLEHPELLDEMDALPYPITDRIDGLLALIERAGSAEAFLDYLDLAFNPQHA